MRNIVRISSCTNCLAVYVLAGKKIMCTVNKIFFLFWCQFFLPSASSFSTYFTPTLGIRCWSCWNNTSYDWVKHVSLAVWSLKVAMLLLHLTMLRTVYILLVVKYIWLISEHKWWLLQTAQLFSLCLLISQVVMYKRLSCQRGTIQCFL